MQQSFKLCSADSMPLAACPEYTQAYFVVDQCDSPWNKFFTLAGGGGSDGQRAFNNVPKSRACAFVYI